MTKPMINSFQTHQGQATTLAFLMRGNRILTGGRDGTIKLWDYESRREIHCFKQHRNRILDLAAMLFEPYFLSSSDDGDVLLWDINDGRVCDRLNYERITGQRPSIVLSENEAITKFVSLALMPHISTVILIPSGLLGPHIWNFRTGQIFHLGRDMIPVGGQDVAVSLTGRLAVSNSGRAIYVWNMQNGKLITTFGGSPSAQADGQSVFIPMGNDPMMNIMKDAMAKVFGGHTADITCFAFSDNELFLLTGSEDQSLRVWNIENLYDMKKPVVLEGHKGIIKGCSFFPNGTRTVSGSADGTIRIWDATSGKMIQEFGLENSPILSFTVSPDRRYAATASSDGAVQIWSLAEWL